MLSACASSDDIGPSSIPPTVNNRSAKAQLGCAPGRIPYNVRPKWRSPPTWPEILLKSLLITLGQAVLILAVAFALGLGVNAARRNSLKLDKNYFEKPVRHGESRSRPASAMSGAAGVVEATDPPPAASQSQPGAQTDPPAAEEPAETPLEHPYRVISFSDALAIVKDPLYATGICVFIDARDDEAWAAGHIPGARRLNPYYAEQFVPDLLPVVFNAERIIVYCNGGDCEDSIYAARELENAGVDVSRIYLFEGGMDAWRSQQGPVEKDSE